MTTTSRELSNLKQYFSVEQPANDIASLALALNESFNAVVKRQAFAFESPYWNLYDAENSSTSTYFTQFVDNSSSLQYAINDTLSNRTKVAAMPRTSTEIPIWLIPCYSVILIFAIVGNLLVASTIFQNRRMRTITNVFLANLAISDILLGVLCMPITLVGTYLRHFIFGELVCKFIQFAQAASVAVSSWTLVAISCERYYAICHPLRSRTWQTINHAYKIIGCIWFGSIICMAPIAIFSQLIPTSRQGLRKCREQWPKETVGYERFYNIFLDLALLVLPLVILCVAYVLITRTLYVGIRDERALIFGSKNNNTSKSAGRNCGTGDAKIYTQVDAEMKTPSVFHLNMSFRYHTRKSDTTNKAASNAFASSFDNGEALERANETNNQTRGTKYCSNTAVANKYSAIGTVSSVAAGTTYTRRGLCYNPSEESPAEREVLFKGTPERSRNEQTHGTDDITLNAAPSAESIAMTTTAKLRALKTKSIHGHQPQMYCLRSASIKSLNQNCIEENQNLQNTASTSLIALNAMPTVDFNKSLQRQQINNQKHPTQQQHQLMHFRRQQSTTESAEKQTLNPTHSLRITESVLRRSNLEKNLESKKRVVKMLFVLVLEFFICWTPLYVINTVTLFIGPAIYEYVDYTTISFFQLLAYSSSCCNPITYCFMNPNFRRAFVDTFKGMHLCGGSLWRESTNNMERAYSVAGNTVALANSCTVVTANTVLDSPRL